jgi:hypothetical protein
MERVSLAVRLANEVWRGLVWPIAWQMKYGEGQFDWSFGKWSMERASLTDRLANEVWRGLVWPFVWQMKYGEGQFDRSFGKWNMERASLTDRVTNEVLHRVQEESSILNTINRMKGNWIWLIWRSNCLLKHVTEGNIEGRIEMTRRWERRRKPLLDDLKERRSYSKLKEEAPASTLWRDRFGGVYGHVVCRLRNKWMDECVTSCTITINITASLRCKLAFCY